MELALKRCIQVLTMLVMIIIDGLQPTYIHDLSPYIQLRRPLPHAMDLNAEPTVYHPRITELYITILKEKFQNQCIPLQQIPFEIPSLFAGIVAQSSLFWFYEFNQQSITSSNLNSRRIHLFGKEVEQFRDSTYEVKRFLSNVTTPRKHPIVEDFEHVLEKYEKRYQDIATTMSLNASLKSLDASLKSLEESRMGIDHNHAVKRLTQLAFVFIPLSFVTGVFGMNIDLLADPGAKWWTSVIAATIVYLIVAIPLIIFTIRSSNGARQIAENIQLESF